MANITKTQFINNLNATTLASANSAKNADATDVTRSGGEITTNNFPAVATSVLSSSTVSGPELQSVLAEFTKQFSRVRKVDFYRNINGNQVYQYSRFARINNSNPDGTRNVESPATYNNIQPLNEINLTQYQIILNNLVNVQVSNYNKHYTNYYYCHSSCHSNCHGSRGRR